jgi:hypothetical protein
MLREAVGELGAALRRCYSVTVYLWLNELSTIGAGIWEHKFAESHPLGMSDLPTDILTAGDALTRAGVGECAGSFKCRSRTLMSAAVTIRVYRSRCIPHHGPPQRTVSEAPVAA